MNVMLDLLRLRTYYTHRLGSAIILGLCVFFCSIVPFVFASETNTNAKADIFLKQLLGAEYRGMGGSFVGLTDGSDALGNNPAGISIDAGNRFSVHMVRFPRTIALLSKPNFDDNYEEYSQYEQRASGIETLNWAFPIGKFGTLGLSLSTAHEGPFRRVNHEGKALNNFPENNLAVGTSYGIKFIDNTFIGFDAKWLRSKITDESGVEHFGRGYAYNVGLIQRIGERFQFGVVVHSLSNGLSFVDASVPDSIRRSISAGCVYKHDFSNASLSLSFDIHPPFTDGIRTNIGTEVWYLSRFGVRIGYIRDIDNRYASVSLLESSTVEMEERPWKAEGICLGLGVRILSWTLDAAYTPQYTPTVETGERLHILQGASVYTFSIGQTF